MQANIDRRRLGKLEFEGEVREVPVKVTFRIEPRNISPCGTIHFAKFFVICDEIWLFVVGDGAKVSTQ